MELDDVIQKYKDEMKKYAGLYLNDSAPTDIKNEAVKESPGKGSELRPINGQNSENGGKNCNHTDENMHSMTDEHNDAEAPEISGNINSQTPPAADDAGKPNGMDCGPNEIYAKPNCMDYISGSTGEGSNSVSDTNCKCDNADQDLIITFYDPCEDEKGREDIKESAQKSEKFITKPEDTVRKAPQPVVRHALHPFFERPAIFRETAPNSLYMPAGSNVKTGRNSTADFVSGSEMPKTNSNMKNRPLNNDTRDKSVMTDSGGHPISDDDNTLTVGRGGQALMQDVQFIDKLAHFDRERIPERVVHAKGAGAYGEFVCYEDMGRYTFADFLSAKGKKTNVFVRFSTVIGGRGSADTVRDPRGFAVKFYTNQGNYDIVGNDLPVFFIRDAIKFPDVIHSLKPSPNNNLIMPERFWDFVSMSPEATHMITWLYSDRGTIKSYRHIEGFGVNTYVWVNREGRRHYIKYHFKTMQGLDTIDRKEAVALAGAEPDIAVKDLYNAIEVGKFPRYELCVQIMDPADAEKLPYDPLDDTKVWSEDDFPLIKVGMMTLNRNPDNFFAETEQSAFCPGNIVPGIEFSADKMLQGRSFSYLDTQRYRLGANFQDLPVNRPKNMVDNNQRDGMSVYNFNKNPINYSPNSLNNNNPLPAKLPDIKGPVISGEIKRQSIKKTDDFTQAGERFRSLTPIGRDHLCENIAVELKHVRKDIADRVLSYFYKADPNFAAGVKAKMNDKRV